MNAEERLLKEKEDKRAPALLLLHQFCSMGKNVQLPMRLALFRSLVDRGILYPVQWALSQGDIKVLNTAGEILAMVLDHDAGGVRGHILRQVEDDAKREAQESAAAAEMSAPNGSNKEVKGKEDAAVATAGGAQSSPTLLAMMSSILISTQHELSLKSQLADSFRTLMDVPGLDATVGLI
jgi:protein phosphatase-4 regulatory subunit 3